MLTAQEIFDKVATHLLTQNAQSMDNRDCMYRAPNGFKCAIGCLIPDEVYNAKIEGNSVVGLFNEHPEVMQKSGLSKLDYTLLLSLQNLHDNKVSILWKECLADLAKHYPLDPKVLENF